MQNNERRLAALEAKASPLDTEHVMFIHFVGMGEVEKEIQRIAHGGQEWQRQPDETVQALKDRSQREGMPNPNGAMVFTCH